MNRRITLISAALAALLFSTAARADRDWLFCYASVNANRDGQLVFFAHSQVFDANGVPQHHDEWTRFITPHVNNALRASGMASQLSWLAQCTTATGYDQAWRLLARWATEAEQRGAVVQQAGFPSG